MDKHCCLHRIALSHATKKLKDNHEIVMAAVSQNWEALIFASQQLKGNHEIVMAAGSQNWLALQHASEELKGSRAIVMAAVSQYGPALQFASEELKGDHKIVMALAAHSTGDRDTIAAILHITQYLLSGRRTPPNKARYPPHLVL